jgi:hypothetical protein
VLKGFINILRVYSDEGKQGKSGSGCSQTTGRFAFISKDIILEVVAKQ